MDSSNRLKRPTSLAPGGTRSYGSSADSARRPGIPSGRVRHDDRGNAVWDWVKGAGRHALESTSRLLKKLEIAHLDVEDTRDEQLRVQSDRDAGGGYDPYNQSAKPRGKGPR